MRSAVTKPYLDPAKTYQNWELFYVRNSTTITIGSGQTFPTLAAAWNYVRNARVATAAYLHLSIVTSNGQLKESFDAPLNLDMDTGSQVSIIGDNAANIQLTFETSNGLVIDSGHNFGSISNITLTGGATSSAVYATTSGSITNLDNIDINGFNRQIDAEQSGRLAFGPNIVETSCIDFGCYVDDGGSVTFANEGLTFSGNPRIRAGLYADRGGRIVAEGAFITNAGDGVIALDGSTVDVQNSTFSGCTKRLRSLLNRVHKRGRQQFRRRQQL